MSLNLTPLKVVEVRDPRTVIRDKEYAILKGGAAGGISWKPYTTTSVSNTSIQYSTPPPNFKTFIDRKMYHVLPTRIVFNSSAPNSNNLLRAGYDAPRAFPISSATSTLSVSLNNTAVSINMADVIHGLLRFNTGQHLKEHEYSMTPSALDMSQEYNDLAGSIKNPLGQYGDSNQDSVTNRGGYSLYTIVSNTPSQAVIDAIFVEPIFLSPYYWGQGNATAFIGIQDMSWNFTFVNNPANRMWSHNQYGVNAPGVITSSQIAFNNFQNLPGGNFTYKTIVPQLLFNYITPQELQHIPREMTYSYFDVARYFSDFPSINPGDTGTLISNTIVLQSIPRRFYIWARNNNAILQSSPNYTDTYLSLAQINPLQISWNNYNGTFSNATAWDIYKMSVKNHCNLSWNEWSGGPVYSNGAFANLIGTVGSPIAIEMGTDIGLKETEAPGMLGQFQLQVTLNVVNTNQTNSITPTLVICVVSEGTFTILDNRSVSQIGVVSAQDVLDAKQHLSDYIDYESIQEINGGNFLSGLKKFGHNLFEGIKSGALKAYEIGKKIAPYVKTGLDIAQTAAKFAPLLGLGDEGGVLLGDVQRGYDYGGAPVGGTPVGGRMMSRTRLRKRLRRA
jgi:hypothetical protein